MRALPFLLSSRMRVTGVEVDGRPAEVFTRESIRESAIRGGFDDLFLVIAPDPIGPGSDHELVIRHEGDVIIPAGNNVFYVGSRGTWYPHQPSAYSRFDMRFTSPKNLTLVATGTQVEDKTEGETRRTRYVTDAPIRFASFNLGEYRKETVSKAGYTVEVYGNRSVEPNLARRTAQPSPGLYRPRHPGEALDLPGTMAVAPDPAVHLKDLSARIGSALDFMISQFGPMPLKTVTVSPIPGFFGQGFPGLVYLSTFAYLSAEDRASTLKNPIQQIFFTDLLPAHELAHQWWGNLVAAEGYQDDWIMEALANYSAVLYLEKRRGTRTAEQILDEYRARLLAKRPNGQSMESTGPIMWGLRLRSAGEEPWRTITYEKGAWIIHMLRRQMGDERFYRMLNELTRRYAYKSVTTEGFRRIAAEFLPPKSPDPTLESFFETWVYGTGIPSLSLEYSVRGKAPALRVTGTVSQSNVDSEFSADVPVEIYTGKAGGPPTVKWVRTSDEPATFSVPIKQVPSKVSLGSQSVLALRK